MDTGTFRYLEAPESSRHMERMHDLHARGDAIICQLNAELGWDLNLEEQAAYRSAVCSHLPEPCPDTTLRNIVWRHHCSERVQQLNAELGWDLNLEEQAAYCSAVYSHLPEPCLDTTLRKIAQNYHADHALVETLADSQHDAYDTAWQAWMGQAVAILKRANLDWSTDVADDIDDLAQEARLALMRSVKTFHYRSRFQTWAYQVVVQSTQRYIRRNYARKRKRPESLDQLPECDIPGDHGYLDAHANGQQLMEQIETILTAQPDQRLMHIFRLWAIEAQSAKEIGNSIHLSPARIRALTAHIRALLRDDPTIAQWQDQPEI